MMRLNFKTVLLVIIVAVLSSILTSWNNCGSPSFFKNTDWKSKFQHKVSKFNLNLHNLIINLIFINIFIKFFIYYLYIIFKLILKKLYNNIKTIIAFYFFKLSIIF